MEERKNVNGLKKKSVVIDRNGVVVVIATFLVMGILILIGQIFYRNNITNDNKKIDEEIEGKINTILASNGVFENENSNLLNAYDDWSYLEMISSVYGGISNCSTKISTSKDESGEYVVTITGTGRDNPYSPRNKTMIMRIKVDINEEKCNYITDSDTYVKYLIMCQNQ